MYVIEQALPSDAETLLGLRDAAAKWLLERGIQQWNPGEVSLATVQDQVAAREWHVARRASTVIAGLRLIWADDTVWGVQPPVAGYVHGLMIDRHYVGSGIGSALLRWAEDQIRSAGRRLLRLDCVESNRKLRSYYERQGFRVVGRLDAVGPWYPSVLLEKRLS